LPRVEADPLAVVVVGLVHAAKGPEQAEVLDPANPELHHHAVDVEDLLVEEVHEQDAAEVLALDVQAQVV
jgi:hypothetical protein